MDLPGALGAAHFKEEKRMAGVNEVQAISQYQKAMNENRSEINNKTSEYGRTVGKPELSDTAKKYYDQLKKKYGNYDFVLVSKEEKENAKANAAKYANGFKTVVLIGEEEIEKMATDENFRKKYEGILSGAEAQLQQLKAQMEASGANVKGYGIQVNDNGTTSFFAVLKKSSIEQKARIEKRVLANREERKKAAKEDAEKRIEKIKEKKTESADPKKEDDVIISSNSLEDLLKKISDYTFDMRSNAVQTEDEKLLGQNIDFKG